MPFSPLEFFSLGKNGKMGRWIHGSPRYQSYLIVIIGSHLYCTNRYTSRTFLSGSSLVGIRSVEMHARGILTLLAHLLYSVLYFLFLVFLSTSSWSVRWLIVPMSGESRRWSLRYIPYPLFSYQTEYNNAIVHTITRVDTLGTLLIITECARTAATSSPTYWAQG